MWIASLVLALIALTYSIWVRLHIRRQSREALDRLREEEDELRSKLTGEQLAYFDKHFEQHGIARK